MKFTVSAFLLTASAVQAAEPMAQDESSTKPIQRSRFLQSATEPINFGESTGNGCVDYTADGSWNLLPRDDDGYYLQSIGINFPWVGSTTSSLYINNNGNLSFDHGISSFSPTALNAHSHSMIAPFWADVDTRDIEDGFVWYKTTSDDKFVVVWEEVAHFGAADDTTRKNTFSVVLSDASYPNRHICFCYEEMAWASGTMNSNEATVGISDGTANTFFLGSFANDGNSWGGVGSTGNNVGYLATEGSWCFDQDAVINPPTEETMCGGPLTPRTESSGGTGGDPHVTTWVGEHFEYHGQCDLTLVKDAEFADGQGLDIQIRTKLVRYWSYIKSVAIKIGNDILEIEGSPDADDAEAHYWINFEYQGELDEFAGFPVTQKLPSTYKRRYNIDLSSKYPDASITIELYKEFVRVRFNGDHRAFGNTVGLMGDYNTGKTLARDGTTVLHDFTEFGDEWQVLPSEPKLFHEVSKPQFPELCIKPEDPRGERKRRLAESTISIEQAEAACATLKDPLSIKDCVYDILATQDLDMVGAF
jgi:hypothetical protein